MATPLSSLVLLFSIGICAGEGLGAIWGGVGGGAGGSEGLPPVALPVPGPSPHRPPVGPSGIGGPGGSAALFAEEPADVVVRKGANAVLRCSPTPAYASWPLSWSKDGQPLDKLDKGHFVVDRAGNLVVHQVSRSDKYLGKYRCALQGPQGLVVSRAAALTVASLSHAVQGPENITLPAGGTVRFSCAVDSVPTARVTWKKDDKPLLTNSRYVTLSSGVLLISNVTSSDEGSYKCITTNDILKKSRISTDAFLQVHESSAGKQATFLSHTKLVHILQGENVSLECSHSGSSFPTWTAPNASLMNSSSNITLPGISILTFHNVHESHSGIYNCTFRETLKTFSQSVELQVLVPPTVLEAPESQSYPTARTARFTCAVHGVPYPTITWYKNGAVVNHSAENGRIKLIDNELLLISNSIASDTGFYQCMFHNSVGENWGLAHLYVNSSGLQAPPSNLTCHEHGDDFIIVHWNPPMGDITAYTVHYWPSGSEMEFKEQLAKKNYCAVTALQPYTNYTFAVRSYSRRGASEPNHVTCETKESVPSVAPQVSLSIISATKLNISWIPLEPAKTNGHVTEYKVQWRQVPRSTSKVKEVPAKVLNFTITDLIPESYYEVRVLARTKQGWPKPAVEAKLEWTSVQMPSQTSPDVIIEAPKDLTTATLSSLNDSVDKTIDPPFGLEAEPTSPYTINVTWSAPPLVIVRYYSVMIKEVQSSHKSESGDPVVINCTSQWLEIDELQPNTIYEVTLKAYDKRGHSSPFSEKIESRTFESAPDVVTDVSWELFNSTAVKVMWKGPNSPVKQFNITMVPLDGSAPIYLLVNGSRSSTEVLGIKPFTAYQLTVWGITRGGTSPPSPTQMVFGTSPEVVQAPPGEQFATQSPDVRLVLSASICGSIAFTVLVMALFWHHTINRSSRRGTSISTSPPNSYQPNGTSINGQLPLTSFVVPDPGPYCYPLGVRRVDTEVHDRSSVKDIEEGNVTLLPPGSNPTPIGANIAHQSGEMKDLAKARTSPCWSGVLPRHVFNITENPQCDSPIPSKNLPSRYGHERSISGNSEEMVELLSARPSMSHTYCESEYEDLCGEAGDTTVDSLNITQITEIDQSFQDKSNNNNDIHNSNVSTNSSHSSVNGDQSRRSSSFLGETSEGSNDLTEQQLLVTLSTVPVHHLSTKPFIDVPKVSVVGPNG